MTTVDLRSDTVTRPTPAMRAAIAAAEVGDDVYGEDPSVNALEAEVAALLGFPAGLFVPTGSLGNQLGIRLLVPPGKELVCDTVAHIVRAELGAAAALAGVTTRTWRADRGRIDVDAIAELITPDAGPYLVSTAAVAVENTHNFGGGTVQPSAALDDLRRLAREQGFALHLDGARLWNAHVASGTPLPELAAGFDTVSVCLSKGSAPRSARCSSPPPSASPRPGCGVSVTARACARPASSLPRDAMRSSTTSAGWPTTTCGAAGWVSRSASIRPRSTRTSWFSTWTTRRVSLLLPGSRAC